MRGNVVRALSPGEDGPADAALVDRALDGDRWAEEALYRRHAPRLLAVVTRLVGDRSDGLDVLQDTFVTTFKKLGSLKEPAAYKGWLLKTGVRLALRLLRKRRLLARLGLLEPGDDAVALAPSRDAPLDVAVELGRLKSALAELSVEERVSWMLRYVEGYELNEVAIACGLSLATTKRRIAAAQSKVKPVVDVGEEQP